MFTAPVSDSPSAPRAMIRLRPHSKLVWKARSRQMSPRVAGVDHSSVAVSYMASVWKKCLSSRPPYMISSGPHAISEWPKRGDGRGPSALSSHGSHMLVTTSSRWRLFVGSEPVHPPKKYALLPTHAAAP